MRQRVEGDLRRVRLGAAMAACAVLAGIGGVAYAAAPSGNARTIAFYGRSQTAMARYADISFDGTGVSYEVIHSHGAYNFRFYFGTTPPGYRTAVDHVQVVQSGGRVAEEVDTMRAPGLPGIRIWQRGHVGEIGEVLSARPCAEPIPPNDASYVTVGSAFVVENGRFARLKRGGHGRMLVRSTFPLSGGIAHETDTIDARTRLWVRSHVVVKGGPNSGDMLAESHFHYSMSQSVEPPPTLGQCP